MRVAILASGTHGDVQPLVALALGLQRAGHQVRFCSHPIFQELASKRGLTFHPLDGTDPKQVMKAVQRATVQVPYLVRLMRHLRQRQVPDMTSLRQLEEACQNSEAVVSSIGIVYHVAEKLKVPFFQAALYPVHPTRAFPHYLSPVQADWAGLGNLLSHHLIRQVFWRRDRRWVNEWRQNALHLPLMPVCGPFKSMKLHRVPCLYGFSTIVIPKPRDWDERLYVTGYWFLDEPVSQGFSHALAEFLDAGPPPIGFAFGSLVDPEPRDLIQAFFAALAAARQRAVVLGGWGFNHDGPTPNEVFWTEWVPFSTLLPRLSAFVHHGGAGSVAEVLRAGLPSVAIPSSGEQRFWAYRLANLKASPPPILRGQLTVAKLAKAIEIICSSQAMREQAQSLGRRIRTENGVDAAVECFNRAFIKNPAT